ncbi:MAG: ACT domain-containing protein, partial [Clostridia bacterium]
ESIQKFLRAKALISSGKAKTVGEAVTKVGISRSAFYKYKDLVRPFYEMASGRIITFHFLLDDRTGVLSSVLREFASAGANVLTVNQTIPIGGQAALTISAETDGMTMKLQKFISHASALDGIVKLEILAGE